MQQQDQRPGPTRKKPPRRFLTRLLIGFALLCLGLGVIGGTLIGGVMLYLRAGLPQQTGVIALTGLDGPTSITRDPYGIPHIEAGTTRDAWFALGFVHAQDRLFQLDLKRRLGAGRLAEIFGADAVPIDRQMRSFGLYRHGEASLKALSPEFRAVLDAYTAGINAWLALGRALPIEFTLLGYRPEPWRPADSIVFEKLLALELSGNYRRELLRARLAIKLSPEQLQQLFPDFTGEGALNLQSLTESWRQVPIDALLHALPALASQTTPAQNWVVDGAHSATGKPLLATDPHLDDGRLDDNVLNSRAVNHWYLARLDAAGLHSAGGTLPGLPMVLIGHNDHIAWGYTAANVDVEDLFIEKQAPGQADRYLTPEGDAPFVTHTEIIHARDAPDQPLTVRETRHGPILSDLVPPIPGQGGTPNENKPGTMIAMAATFLSDDDRTIEAQWRINQAQNWPDFTAALRLVTAPALTLVYADTEGNIGSYAPGHIPIRRSGDGRAPVPGWTGRFDWSGWIPFDALPHRFNPGIGRLANAEPKTPPITDLAPSPDYITDGGDPNDRADHLESRLRDTPQQSVAAASTQLMQNQISASAQRLLPLLLAVPPVTAAEKTAHDLLKAWDGAIKPDRPESLIFQAWQRALNHRIYADELGELSSEYTSINPYFIEDVLKKYPKWCDNILTPEIETCDSEIRAALDEALTQLTQRHGADISQWRWDSQRRSDFRRHPPFGRALWRRLSWLRLLFNPSNPGETGDEAGPPADPQYSVGLRAIYDLSDLENSVFMSAPGESGTVISPHYSDLLSLWRSFDWLRLPAIGGGDTLTLMPLETDRTKRDKLVP